MGNSRGLRQRARAHHQRHRRWLIIGALGRLMLPGRQDMPIWLTILIGIVAALIGSLIASALGVGETRGMDWIKLIIQVALAAAGVALVAAGTHLAEGASRARAWLLRRGSTAGSPSGPPRLYLDPPSRLGSWRWRRW